ncbi:MAG: MFS transporter [Thalassobaculum sp.]|uniref:MFS transporter n=1 Tax=Thalassobaculum sp. TaxID=2022740 RepID=UPI0032EEFEF9
MGGNRLPTFLSERLPFYYGWIVLAGVCCAGFSRQGPAVATLSVFVEPMTGEFGWSRTAISGAVSLGGILAAFASPLIGPQLDRHGAKVILAAAVLVTGVAVTLLSTVQSLLAFYLLFCVARMNFAGPYDIGIYGAVNNWFVARRAQAASIATLAQMLGLVAMPLIAHAAILSGDWRNGWLAVGATVLVIGFVPNWLLMVRRPEDIGLDPDRPAGPAASGPAAPEPAFTRAAALRTPTFWLLSLFTFLVYPVQAGVSLHQAPYLIERGLDPTVAATVVSTFSAGSAVGSLVFGMGARRLGMRATLSLIALLMGAGTVVLLGVHGAPQAYAGGALYGLGIGGLVVALPVAWADCFGRRSYGAIRGVALSIQVTAQAIGPVLSGALRDWTGDYVLSLELFTALALSGAAVALLVRAPKP